MSIRPARWVSSALPIATLAVSLLIVATPQAHAHFFLMSPACYSAQDAVGTPTKSAPCGQADTRNPVVATGEVTTLVQGGMLTVTLEERIAHPGHYRIAIAPDMDSLPADPPVTASSSTACGTTVIDDSPALPVLADGVFVHTRALMGVQTIDIPLPADFTCDHCVVQVTEFMSNHGLNPQGGCFYHHCADVRVLAAGVDGGVATDGGSPATDGGVPSDGGVVARDGGVRADGGAPPADGSTTTPGSDSGCGCHVVPAREPRGALFAGACLVALGLSRMRRSRRSRT